VSVNDQVDLACGLFEQSLHELHEQAAVKFTVNTMKARCPRLVIAEIILQPKR